MDNGRERGFTGVATTLIGIVGVIVLASGLVFGQNFSAAMSGSVRDASGAVLPVLLSLLGKACVIAIQLAAPVSVALLLATFALGIITRLVPQLNVFSLSFPATLGLGLVMMALALPYLIGGMQLAFGRLGNDLMQVISVLGAR